MSRALLAVAAIAVMSGTALAEPLPPGSLGVTVGALSGTGADASQLGFGFQWGGQASWQPMTTEQRVGWAASWAFSFARMYAANAASVDSLLLFQMDLMLGIRIRPGTNPSRYITLRGGGELLRANQIVPPREQRAFAGAVASVGIDQYAYGFLLNLDVRISQIGTGPTMIALMFGAAKTGP